MTIQLYAQKFKTPTVLEEERLVELALQQQYGIFTVSHSIKYSLPYFDQRERNGTHSPSIDRRGSNHLIKHDFSDHNYPLTGIAGKAQQMAGN